MHHRKTAEEFEEYKDIKPFEFLPGHRALILGIKAEILDLQTKKKPKIAKSNKLHQVENENTLQFALINQMSNFAKGIGLSVDWSNCIQDFTLTTVENTKFAQCKLSCPICTTQLTIRFDRNWKISNLCRHLRRHSTDTTNVDFSAVNLAENSSPSVTTTSTKIMSQIAAQKANNIEIISVEVLREAESNNVNKPYDATMYDDLIEYDGEISDNYTSSL